MVVPPSSSSVRYLVMAIRVSQVVPIYPLGPVGGGAILSQLPQCILRAQGVTPQLWV